MSTRLSDLQTYRNWQGYGTGYPVGIYTIPKGAFKNFTGCESVTYSRNGKIFKDRIDSEIDLALTATVPTDGNAQTMDCAVCGEKHGDPIEYGGMKLYACPKVPDDGTIINMTAIIEKYGKR